MLLSANEEMPTDEKQWQRIKEGRKCKKGRPRQRNLREKSRRRKTSEVEKLTTKEKNLSRISVHFGRKREHATAASSNMLSGIMPNILKELFM